MGTVMARTGVLSALWILVSLAVVQPCRGESLRVLERHALGRYSGVAYALRMGGDTTIVLSSTGLYMQADTSQEWQKMLDRVRAGEQVLFSVCDNDRLTRIIDPEGLWLVTASDGKEILIGESFCGRLYRLCQASDGSSYLTKYEKQKDDHVIKTSCLQDGTILTALFGNNSKEKIVIQPIDGGKSRKLFRCSDELLRWRDSVDLDHSYLGTPAVNPHDSTLWLAVQGYSHIYVIDMDGKLCDSLPITDAAYLRPPRPKSRIGSDAVTADWFAQWTNITSFSYVPPGYFILQFRAGTEPCGAEKLIRYSTIAWDAERNVVPLSVDPRWHVAGVQDDGRILFVARETDSTGGCTETLIVTRIEP